MGCPSCGAESPSTNKFCGECGAALALACGGCGTRNPPTNHFCGECGAPLAAGAGTPAAVPPVPPPSPQSYTPRHLAQKILASRADLEGERKQVTVLFADVVGSTELIRDLDPEDAQGLLDGAVTRMMEAVHRFEGTVSRAMGDGIIALFGAPLAHEDHAIRACYAALAMQEAARRYAEDVRSARGVTLAIRVGLNSGEVVVRAIRDDLHMDYSAMGQTVHLASRLEQLAKPGTVALSTGTLGLVDGYVRVRPLGPVAVKGLDQPVELFELVGVGQVRTRLQAAAARGLTRFVGRREELVAVYRAFERVEAGRGQVVALVGEPGVGKSRLVWEVTHAHRTEGWTVLQAGSVSYGKATSYLPVIDLLKSYCRIESRDDARAIREKVSGKLLTLDRTLESLLPALLWLLDAAADDEAWRALDPPRRRLQTLDGLKRLLLRVSQDRPLLLVFEDLHWIDAETQALLDGLVESLPTAPVLLLVNYRPEYHHAWGGKTYYTQLRVDPLRPENADELLEALLGPDPSVEPLKQHLIERTDGNPFFLEESVRALAETGILAGERGAYRLTKGLPSIRVPATVQAVLASRIDRLAPAEKRLLQSAAVIGKDVPDALLRAITELVEEEVYASLTRLQAAEFLYEAGLFPELEYTFKHALTHEVAYGGVLQERRRALHARIVDAIEHEYADRLVEQIERLAQHAFRGQVWDKALAYLRQAGARAVARSAHHEAVGYFEQALVALQHRPEGRERREQAIDLRLELRNALFPLGELDRILDYLREAETLAADLDDQRRLGWVSAYQSAAFWLRNDYARAIASGQRAHEIAGVLDDLVLRLQSKHRLGNIFLSLGDYHRAAGFLREIIESLGGDLVRERFGQDALPAVIDRQWLAWCLAQLGRFPEALVHAHDAVRIAESIDAAYDLILAYRGLGGVYLRQGHVQEALGALERATALCRDAQIRVLFDFTASNLGYALALSGRAVDGVHLLEEALGQPGSTGSASHSLLVTYLSESYLLAGRIEESLAAAQRALALAREYGERGHQAYAVRLLGEIATRRHRSGINQAEGHFRVALALAEELGMRPLQAHCHLGLGKLYIRTGRLDEARAELSTAVAMLREMGMAFWLPEAERELAEAGR